MKRLWRILAVLAVGFAFVLPAAAEDNGAATGFLLELFRQAKSVIAQVGWLTILLIAAGILAALCFIALFTCRHRLRQSVRRNRQYRR